MKYNKYKLDNSILFDVYTYPKNSNSLQEYIHKFTESIILTAALEKSGRNYEHHINSIKQLCLNCVVSVIAQQFEWIMLIFFCFIYKQ